MNAMRIGATTAVVVALIIGMGLITQDTSPHFFTSYFTIAMPIALTAGCLAWSIAALFKHKKGDKNDSCR